MIYSNSDMRQAIEEYCHVAKHRELLRLRYCDGLTYEEISEAVNYSPQHVKHVCRSYKETLMNRI